MIGSLKKSGERELDAIQIGCGHVVRYSWLAVWLRHLANHGYSIDEFRPRTPGHGKRLAINLTIRNRQPAFLLPPQPFDINGIGRIPYSTFTIVSAPRSTTDAKGLTTGHHGRRTAAQWRKAHSWAINQPFRWHHDLRHRSSADLGTDWKSCCRRHRSHGNLSMSWST